MKRFIVFILKLPLLLIAGIFPALLLYVLLVELDGWKFIVPLVFFIVAFCWADMRTINFILK